MCDEMEILATTEPRDLKELNGILRVYVEAPEDL